MPRRSGKTTAPAPESTPDPRAAPLLLALAIAWSDEEPERAGEVALLPAGRRLFVGRGDGDDDEGFAQFGEHRPGAPLAFEAREELLAGPAISARQLEVCSNGREVEVKVVGRCATHVNGALVEKGRTAALRPGDRLLLEGQVLFVCVARPAGLARPPGLAELHAFGGPDAHGIVGESAAAWELRAQIARAAKIGRHVLVQGESGTGKEKTAAAIHRLSARSNRVYVAVNAKAFPPGLATSELFGNVAGYPNQGMPARPGVVGAADGGTLFLDEIGELPEDAQAELLRVLDAGECRRVGEGTSRRVDLFVIGATNRRDGRFRLDFRARFPSHVLVPPLRDRREDIPLLLVYVLQAMARKDPEVGRRFLTTAKNGRVVANVSTTA